MTLCLVFLLILFYVGALIILEKRLIRNCLYVCMYVEEKWQQFEDAYKETAKSVLGYKKEGTKTMDQQRIMDLVEERKKLKSNIEQAKSSRIKEEYRTKDKEVKKSMRNMRKDKRKWADELASEAERAAGNVRMKELYQITKTLCNEKSKTCNTVKDKDGNLLTEDSERRKRWQEHFEEILNRPIPDNPVSNEPNEHDEQVLEDISTDCISKAEIRAAIRKMRNGKSGGKNEITVELLKADIDTTVD